MQTLQFIFGLLGIGFTGLAGAMLWAGLKLWLEVRRLNQEGVEVDAQVIQREVVHSGKTDLHYIAYQFYVPSPETQPLFYQRQQQVSDNTYHNLLVGDLLTIIYLPADPKISRLAGVQRDNADLFFFPSIGLIMLALGLWLLYKTATL